MGFKSHETWQVVAIVPHLAVIRQKTLTEEEEEEEDVVKGWTIGRL